MLLAVVRSLRWTEGYERLGRECQLYCLDRISHRWDVGNTSSKLSCPSSIVTRRISREFTWWNALRGVLLSSIKVRGFSRRAVSIVPESLETPDISEDECGEKREAACKAQASNHLQRLLGINEREAQICVDKHRGFAVTDPDDIQDNYEACRDAGFSETGIKNNPEMLSYPKRIHNVKLQLIINLGIEHIDDAVPFFKLGITQLRLFSNHLKRETEDNEGINRLTYLAEQLQCPMLEVCEVVAKHHFMRTVSLSKISKVLKIMLDAQVTKTDIINDIWAFRYSPDIITERFKRLTEARVFPVKPWMIRCPETGLLKRIKRELRRRSILGETGTVVEYLTQRFECDEKIIVSMIEKFPKIIQVNEPKLKLVIDFLLENGYTVDHVFRVPRIFLHSLETIQQRFLELKNYGHKPNTIMVFCKSKREYSAYLKIVKHKFAAENKT